VRSHSWLKPRNTLDRSWQRKNLMEELALRNSVGRRVRRTLMKVYKGAPMGAMVTSVMAMV
jgi:hypothetical protein